MSGLFWNPRGLGEYNKRRFIKDAIADHNLDFICIQETKREDFPETWLNNLSGRFTFIWLWEPSRGASGGLLMGVNEEKFDVGSCFSNKFFTRMVIMDKQTRFKWNLVNVYGASNARDKPDFLIDLVHVLNSSSLPFVVGGDFNLVRRISERNKPKRLSKWSALFNSIIEHWGLKELVLSGRSFTWSNNQADPLFELLDRVLVSPEWELEYPLVSVRTLVRGVSDHAALLLDVGNIPVTVNKPFKFELSWFLREDLEYVVKKVWNATYKGRNCLDRWHNCFTKMRSMLKGWNNNVEGQYKRDRDTIASQLDFIDKNSETQGLSMEDYELRCSLQASLNHILKEEEIKWFQRAKERDLLEGDSNTRYFMIKASGRKRRNKIFRLFDEDMCIEGTENLLEHATNYYKTLFGPVELLPVSLSDPVPMVLDDRDRLDLIAPFSLEEIKTAVFSMEHNRAPGPDGFPIEFFQKFWDLVSPNLFSLFQDFHRGSLDIKRFNYGIITLIPKGQGADRLTMFRPICLLNVVFKIFTKVLNNRTICLADKIVDDIQSAFIKGRFILDSVVLLHETIHYMHKRKKPGILFKVDFEKAYDKIN